MDLHTFAQAMGANLTQAEYAGLLPAYEEAMRQARINTVRRAAMFAAQLGHESVGLRYLEEIASGQAYEGRKDLGNTQPGDGRRFKGRGAIQITGRANYTALSKWAHGRGLVPDPAYFVQNPSELATKKHAFTGAVWYWTVARPHLNDLSDRGDVQGATRAINGGLNGLEDRNRRYTNALTLGEKLLPAKKGTNVVYEKVIPYSRSDVRQDTDYNCGPASTQTVILGRTGRVVQEAELGRALGTHRGGTDYIGQFPRVLNAYTDGGYRHQDLPNYPTAFQLDELWQRIKAGVEAGLGTVVNIVAPPSNYPRAVPPSTDQPEYRGGVVYHYIAAMGVREDVEGRKVWIADSGFPPYGYWISLTQLGSLIVPKGYAYPTNTAKKVVLPAQTESEKNSMEKKITEIWEQLRGVAGRGWPQLGKNSKGENLTVVDALAAIRVQLTEVQATVNELKEGK